MKALMRRNHKFSILVTFSVLWSSAFGDQIRTCPVGQHWVRAHHRDAYVRLDGTLVSASFVNAHCAKDPPNYSDWKGKLKLGLPPAWPNRSELPSHWKTAEQERVLEALSNLPDELLNSGLKGVYRLKQSMIPSNPGAGDRLGNIVLYNNAFKSDKNLTKILAHELSHRVFQDLERGSLLSFLKVAQWANVSTDIHLPQMILTRSQVGLPDSVLSPEEDFSNLIEEYLFDGEQLKKRNPDLYLWIRNHFKPNFKLGRLK